MTKKSLKALEEGIESKLSALERMERPEIDTDDNNFSSELYTEWTIACMRFDTQFTALFRALKDEIEAYRIALDDEKDPDKYQEATENICKWAERLIRKHPLYGTDFFIPNPLFDFLAKRIHSFALDRMEEAVSRDVSISSFSIDSVSFCEAMILRERQSETPRENFIARNIELACDLFDFWGRKAGLEDTRVFLKYFTKDGELLAALVQKVDDMYENPEPYKRPVFDDPEDEDPENFDDDEDWTPE